MSSSAYFSSGLTTAEVAQRVMDGQTNAYHVNLNRSYWAIVRDNVFTLFNGCLAILFVIMAVQHDFTNILLAGFAVAANILFGLIQEIKARQALEQLSALSASRVEVLRDGKYSRIAVTDVVKDDILPIQVGDRIVADGKLLQTDSLEVDESQLTGESDWISKSAEDMVWSGSFCIAGKGLMIATCVGAQSSINQLSATAKHYRQVLTPTQVQINKLVTGSALAILIIGPLLIGSGILTHLPLLEISRNAVVLVTSLIAQGFVLTTTLSFLLGAIRISREKVLVQRINAIESLAHANVLCFDKTGTLTCNQLVVTEINPSAPHSMTTVESLLRLYVSNLAFLNGTASAIATAVGKLNFLKPVETKLREIPFNSDRRWGAIEFADRVLILGAAEMLLDPSTNQALLERVHTAACTGARVLVFATCENLEPEKQLLGQVEPIALILLNDQIRDDIQTTLHTFSDQGVALKIISGDSSETVCAVAKTAGIEVKHVYTGAQLETLPEQEFRKVVTEADVFARISPTTKRKIIAALKHQGLYTAMIGDGVNDVPALKEAHLAIAMNDGAQIAKDVADVVLLNNALSTLPIAFNEGKTITRKIYGMARLFLVKNFCAVGLIITISLLMLPFPFTPASISWLTLVMINIPGLLITFDRVRPHYFQDFNRDVLGYVFRLALPGLLSSLLVYLGTYRLVISGAWGISVNAILTASQDMARGNLFIYLSLFAALVFWQTYGLDILRPSTFREHQKELGIGCGLLLITIVPTLLFGMLGALFLPTLQSVPFILGMFGLLVFASKAVRGWSL
jgi:cation-transporting ATPase E